MLYTFIKVKNAFRNQKQNEKKVRLWGLLLQLHYFSQHLLSKVFSPLSQRSFAHSLSLSLSLKVLSKVKARFVSPFSHCSLDKRHVVPLSQRARGSPSSRRAAVLRLFTPTSSEPNLNFFCLKPLAFYGSQGNQTIKILTNKNLWLLTMASRKTYLISKAVEIKGAISVKAFLSPFISSLITVLCFLP